MRLWLTFCLLGTEVHLYLAHTTLSIFDTSNFVFFSDVYHTCRIPTIGSSGLVKLVRFFSGYRDVYQHPSFHC